MRISSPCSAVFLAVAALIVPTVVTAQAQEPAATDATIEEFLEIAHMGELLDSSIEVMLKAQIEQSPELIPYETVMRSFLKRYMSFESMKQDFVTLYRSNFSDADLKAAIVFYRTPAGQRILARTPQLMADGGAIGQQRVKDHLPELMAMIQAQEGNGSVAPADQN